MNNRRSIIGPSALLGLLIALLAWTGVVHADARTDAAGPRIGVDKMFVVDCLLPGQVRQLGTKMTYISARRALKTSAGECEVQGGEYVAQDRSTLTAQLAVWLPQAQTGDKQAQTYVGEIYERGAGGTPPDYANAAQWYRKAADQGYSRALINLGFLYEKGLGVPKEPNTALNLYRKASGLDGLITLEQPAVAAARDAEVQALRRELDETRKALDNARKELSKRESDARSQQEQIEKQKAQAASTGNLALVRQLETQLKAREDELNRQRDAVARLEQTAAQHREQLAGAASASAAMRTELDQLRKQVASTSGELQDGRGRASELQRQLEATKQELNRERQQTGQQSAATAGRDARIKTLEAELQARSDDAARQAREIARMEQESKRYKDQLAALEAKSKAATTAAAEGPISIQLIDPQLVATRTPATIRVSSGIGTRDIVGKVTAPAGLLSLTINDTAQAVDAQGLFKASIPVNSPSTPVRITAIDTRGVGSSLQFSLVPDAAPDPLKALMASVDFGNYHALVIGNQNYKKLPRLDTAGADAQAVASILTNKYGFKVTTVMDGTRYQILSELNRLRGSLTEKDNLLVYYAGHGEIDRANLRGHWLPVDAEPDSDANWISSVAVTDILNAMSVKHVLVVADSCYSGAMTRSSVGQIASGMQEETRISWIKALAKSRSRTVFTSGGIQPVMDGGGGKHSVFAQSFLSVLTANQDFLEGERLYREVAARVLETASKFGVEQQPQYAALRFAGHESGDFVFLPVGASRTTASR